MATRWTYGGGQRRRDDHSDVELGHDDEDGPWHQEIDENDEEPQWQRRRPKHHHERQQYKQQRRHDQASRQKQQQPPQEQQYGDRNGYEPYARRQSARAGREHDHHQQMNRSSSMTDSNLRQSGRSKLLASRRTGTLPQGKYTATVTAPPD